MLQACVPAFCYRLRENRTDAMTIEATTDSALVPATAAPSASPLIHPLWVRLTHWINALAMLMMIGSGWQIYDASPLFNFVFPTQIALGEWLAGALLWHFAAMWLLVINGAVYLTLGIATGRFRRKLLPLRPSEVVRDFAAALRGKLSHEDLSVYNAVQKLLYAGVLLAGFVIVLTGLSIWKPVQFKYLTALFGGYDVARYVHFFAMASIVAFLTVHVALALIVPKSLWAMIFGSPAARGDSYVARHWRGDLSLARSYWVDGVLITILISTILYVGVSVFGLSSPGDAGRSSAGFIVLAILILVYAWQSVGIWRSAGHYVDRGGNKVWAILAKILVVTGVAVAILTAVR
jgi:thiosulfate reductase cytochrome b subunit